MGIDYEALNRQNEALERIAVATEQIAQHFDEGEPLPRFASMLRESPQEGVPGDPPDYPAPPGLWDARFAASEEGREP